MSKSRNAPSVDFYSLEIEYSCLRKQMVCFVSSRNKNEVLFFGRNDSVCQKCVLLCWASGLFRRKRLFLRFDVSGLLPFKGKGHVLENEFKTRA